MAAGSIIIDLLMRTGSFETDTKRAEKRLRDFQKSANDFGKKLGTAIGAGAAAGAAALTALTVQAINFADEINDMSQKVGVSTETLSAWGYATKQAGADIEALNTALPRLAKNLAAAADEGSRQAELFKALGVDVKDAAGNLRSVESILPELADRFKQLNNETTEAALAQELFGRSGANLLQFLNEGSDGLQTMTDRARELGVVIEKETAQAAGEFNDKLDDLRAVALGLGVDIASKLLPALNDTLDKLVKLTKQGDLAENAVTVMSAAFSAGVGAIDFYNKAVSRLSIEIERVVRSFTALQKISAAASPFSLKSPIQRYKDAAEAIKELNAADADAEAAWEAEMNRLAGGPGSDGTNAIGTGRGRRGRTVNIRESTATAGLEDSVSRFFSANDVKERTKKVKEELSAEEKAWREWEEEMADVFQGIAEASQEYEQRSVDQHNALLDINMALDEQIKMLGMSAKEQEAYNLAAQAGVSIDSEAGRVIAEKVSQLYDQAEALRDQTYAMDALRDAGSDFFTDWISGAKSFKDAALDALDSLNKRILQMIADNLMEKLFGEFGTTGTGSTAGTAGGGWGQAIGSFIGSIFGGARAGGGDVWGNRAYLVGEQGPEMFVPNTAGTIIPAGRTAAMTRGGMGGFNQTIINNYQGRPDRRTVDQIASDVGRKSQVAMRRNGAA